MDQDQIERFFHELVSTARSRGIPCAITSGMACVALGLSAATKDCDVLCAPRAADVFLEMLCQTNCNGAPCHYRGRISPPLDKRWLLGGWTSHFEWPIRHAVVHLDVFGVPPRVSKQWEPEVRGLYAGLQTLAEMKRTDREKDWPYVTAVGILMLESGDEGGWLHIYDADALSVLASKVTCPAEIAARRPVLQLALNRDNKLAGALRVERAFWEELDRIRILIYRGAARPYLVAVRRAVGRLKPDLATEHALRVQCAEQFLTVNPVREYGLENMIKEAREAAAVSAKPEFLDLLPDVREHFRELLT
jgi:hypothetical protein